MHSKRKAATKMILDTLSLLDKTGLNTAKYEKIFSEMSDTKFDKWVENEQENLYLEVLPFKNEPTISDIKKAAKSINVPLEEYVYLRNDGSDPDNPSRTKYRVPVGVLMIKKLQQFLTKKNSFATGIGTRNTKFNQATGGDDASKITEPELYSLTAIGAENMLKELMGPRSDGESKDDFYRGLSVNGVSYLEDNVDKLSGKRTLNLVNSYLLAMGINSSIISPGHLINADQMDINKKQEAKQKERRKNERK